MAPLADPVVLLTAAAVTLPPVRNRRPWHDDVEAEFWRQKDFTLDDIVASVLKRDPRYPADAVRRYAEFVLKCATV